MLVNVVRELIDFEDRADPELIKIANHLQFIDAVQMQFAAKIELR